MVRAFILSLLIFITTINTYSKEQSNDLQISLLTCSTGEEIYAAFGHNAVRVKDPANNSDIVFDYGVFNYQEPNFVWKFTRGNLKYQLTISDFNDFMDMYRRLNRGVVEEKLNLTEGEKHQFLAWMLDNYRPENRNYYYDFMFDNCSTRIRDLVDSLHTYNAAGGENFVPSVSFRDNLAKYFKHMPWYKFGTDLILGARVDQKMSFSEEMFLPDNLSANLRSYRRIDNNNELLSTSKILVQNVPFSIQTWKKYLTPLNSFILMFLVLILLSWRKPALEKPFMTFIFILYGLTGLMLVFMWIGTSHYSSKENWNILWLNPLYVLLLTRNGKRIKNILLWMLVVIDLCILLFWKVIPQELNFAIIPLIATGLYFKVRMMKWPRWISSRGFQKQVQ